MVKVLIQATVGSRAPHLHPLQNRVASSDKNKASYRIMNRVTLLIDGYDQ